MKEKPNEQPCSIDCKVSEEDRVFASETTAETHDIKHKEELVDKDDIREAPKQDKATLIFKISLIPYALLIIYAICCAIFGYASAGFLETYTAYGLDAIFQVLLWEGIRFTIIPIFPICLIYQVIYLFIYLVVKRDRKLAKKFSIFLLVIAAIVIVSVSTVEIRRRELIVTGTEMVNSYLIEKFGEEKFNNMQIVSARLGRGDIFGNRLPELSCIISTSLMENDFEVTLSLENGTLSDTFSSVVIETNQFEEKLAERFINSLPQLPSNVEISMKASITNFHEVYEPSYTNEELLKKFEAEYIIYSFDIKVEQYAQEEALDIVKNLCVTYYDLLKNHSNVEPRIKFYFLIKTDRFESWPYEYYADGYIRKISNNQAEIEFGAYTLEGGKKTIEEFKEIFDI